MDDAVLIRDAALADCDALAAVHVAAWRETYAGLMSADYIAARSSVSVRTGQWRGWIEAAIAATPVLLAEQDGTIVGFASGGPCRDEFLGQEMEIYMLYLLDRAKRRGIGGALFSTLTSRFTAQGAKSAGLWVLRDNTPARGFYENQGGRLIAGEGVLRPGFALPDVAYIWPDLRAITPKS